MDSPRIIILRFHPVYILLIGMSIVDNEKYTMLQKFFRSNAQYSSGDPIVADKVWVGNMVYMVHGVCVGHVYGVLFWNMMCTV